MRHSLDSARAAGRFIGLAALALSLLALAALGLGPRTGRYRTLTVLSGSMRPTAPEGSVVVMTPVRLESIKVGDVIAYQIPVEDHRVVSHRVVEVVEGGSAPVVRTKGDANPVPDPWLARLQGGSAWKMRGVVPHLGRAVSWLRQPLVRRLGLLVVPALLALSLLADIWAPTRRRPRMKPAHA